MKVTKYSGEQVRYDEQKLINSLKKSGADNAVAKAIVKKIEGELYEGIPSKNLFHHKFHNFCPSAGNRFEKIQTFCLIGQVNAGSFTIPCGCVNRTAHIVAYNNFSIADLLRIGYQNVKTSV